MLVSKEETLAHLKNPKAGDRFTEMFAYWVHVVDVSGERVCIEEYNPPCRIPDDRKKSIILKAQLAGRFCYKNTETPWVRFVDNNPEQCGLVQSIAGKYETG